MLSTGKITILDRKIANLAATETSLPQSPISVSAVNPVAKPVQSRFTPNTYEVLVPRCPDPYEGFQPLQRYLVHEIASRVTYYLKKICRTRECRLDFGYWEKRTFDILSTENPEHPIVVPSRAGSGKSTWLRAFLLALMEFKLNTPDVAESLGGVMIVIQKVEELNDIVATVYEFFPQVNADIVALQSWSKDGANRGFCKMPGVEGFQSCQREQCEFACTCDVLRFCREAESAFILGITQARFDILRKSESLDQFLWRPVGLSRVPRRFLIFDEKFNFSQVQALNLSLINAASTELESLISLGRTSDRIIQRQQSGLNYNLSRPFLQLRKDLVLERMDKPIVDIPFGLCSLNTAGSDEQCRYYEFRAHIFQKPVLATKSLRLCISVMDQLYDGPPCLFTKQNGFCVFSIAPPRLCYGQSQTIVFDATAEVDGDYQYLQNVQILPSSPPRHMDKLTLHIYTGSLFNVSKSALTRQDWKAEALARMVVHILGESEGGVFLCVYQGFAETFLAALKKRLSKTDMERIMCMPGHVDCLPYFNGTNGSNCFNACTNVILLGYPRLPPQNYLAETYAAWGDYGFREQFKTACDHIRTLDTPQSFKIFDLPMVQEYQTHHLAARLEQELYRCKLRNYQCDDQIHVYLFNPSTQLQKLIESRFPDSHIAEVSEVPHDVYACCEQARSYKGRPTAYGKLSQYFESWDGNEISVQKLREKLEISSAVWKDLMKEDRVVSLFEHYNIQRVGRGRNCKIYCKNSESIVTPTPHSQYAESGSTQQSKLCS